MPTIVRRGNPPRTYIAALPVPVGSFTFNGSSQGPTWTGYDSNALTIGGTTSAVNAGTYTTTFTPKTNYYWADNSGSEARSVTWTIRKATGLLAINKTVMALDVLTSDTIVATTTGDGVVSAVSSNTGVVNVSVSGKTITVTKVGNGSATITVSLSGTNNYTAPVSVYCNVTVATVATTMSDNSWDIISKVAASGQAQNYWSIGATKPITLSGQVATLYSLNLNVLVYIIGFNHNGAMNTIDFGTFKLQSNSRDVCLTDSNYNRQIFGSTPTFNFYRSQSFGAASNWKNCDLRYDVLGSTNVHSGNATATTATNPVGNTVMSVLPADLRAVMKPMTIYTDNVGNGTDTASNVTTTVDYLPLLSEFEVFGVRTWANSAEQTYQKKYPYFSSGPSRLKFRQDGTSVANWWLRSPTMLAAGYMCAVYWNEQDDDGITKGTVTYSTSDRSYGLAPIFRV